MAPDELNALKEYIKAVVDEKIEYAFGRDSHHEAMAVRSAEDDLDNAIKKQGA